MRRKQLIALVALLGLAIVPIRASAADTTTTAAPVRLAALAPRVPDGATRARRAADADQPLTVTVVLQPSHTDELDALLHDLYDPASPRYGQWLATGEFAQRFGPTRPRSTRVTSWLHDQGLTDTRSWAWPYARAATRRRSAARSACRSRSSGSPEGDHGYVASAAPLVPSAVADDITTIVGLSHAVPAAQLARPLAASGTCSPAGPSCLAQAVRSAPRRERHRGQRRPRARRRGTSPATTSGPPTRSAASTTSTTCSPRASPAREERSRCSSSGGVARPTPTATSGASACTTGEGQAHRRRRDSDADRHARSRDRHPRSGDAGAGRDDRLVRSTEHHDRRVQRVQPIVTDNSAQVISTSWGKCEALLPRRAERRRRSSTRCTRCSNKQPRRDRACSPRAATPAPKTATTAPPLRRARRLQVDNPADDPFVTGVGGTALEEPGVEPVWNDCEGQVGDACAVAGQDAGGRRPVDDLQAAEVAAGRGERDVPDVSRRPRHLGQRRRRRDVLRLRPQPDRVRLDRGRRHEHRGADDGRHRRRHRAGLQGRAGRQLRAQARRARGEARVRHRAHRRHHRHQLEHASRSRIPATTT